MHQTRQELTRKIPIQRKGTKYVVRALSDVKNSVPVAIAVRDMLKLARTTKEVKKMIHKKVIKLNGRLVRDERESIRLFNVLEIGKSYVLTLLPTEKFALEESKVDSRLCKVTGRKLVKGNQIQLNLHDGTNLVAKDKINVGDSIYLDFSGKIKKHISLEKGREVFIMSGKYVGQSGKISEIKNKIALIKFETGEAELSIAQIIAR